MQALLPVWRARVPDAIKLRRLSDATCEEIRRSGLARILQPIRYGGCEAPLISMIDVLVPAASACSATAWCLAQFLIHNYMIARWPKSAQDAVWIDKPDALVSGILIPLLGKAKRVNGGANLSGRWPFVSGIAGADWCILSGMMEDEAGGAAIESYFLLPAEQVTILDTWYSIGLQGSGSNHVEVKEHFIPAHMIITAKDLRGGEFAGRAANPGALFRPPVYMTFGILLTSTVLGMANAMLAEYLFQSRKTVAIMSGEMIGTFQAQQTKVGEATAALNAAQALIRADASEIQALAVADERPDDATRSKYRSNAAYASGLAYWAAERIFDLAGARAIYADSEIGRIFLDIIVAKRHVTQNVGINTAEHGRARMNLPLTNPSL
jgi:3-hydroxy-9,10-secoandrosta-1,3,5(10)-triene-9,17-dione monooxygenase